MTFQVGERCRLRYSHSCRKYSLKHGVITGKLGMYKYYDDFGECQGERLAYKVSVDGVEVCAPPEMLMEAVCD